MSTINLTAPGDFYIVISADEGEESWDNGSDIVSMGNGTWEIYSSLTDAEAAACSLSEDEGGRYGVVLRCNTYGYSVETTTNAFTVVTPKPPRKPRKPKEPIKRGRALNLTGI